MKRLSAMFGINVWGYVDIRHVVQSCQMGTDDQLGPVFRKPINANPRLKINQGVYFSTPKCCTTLMFGKILH